MRTVKPAVAVVVVVVVVLAGCGSSSHKSTEASATTSSAPKLPARASAADLTTALERAGLGITQVIVYSASTDPNHLLGRNGGYTSKTAWVDPAAISAGAGDPSSDPGGTEFGGSIEVFATGSEATAREHYVQSFGPALSDGYDYVEGDALLRLSHYLTPDQAKAYDTALHHVTGG